MAKGDVLHCDNGQWLPIDHCCCGRGFYPKIAPVLSKAMEFPQPDVCLLCDSGIKESSDPKVLRLIIIKDAG